MPFSSREERIARWFLICGFILGTIEGLLIAFLIWMVRIILHG